MVGLSLVTIAILIAFKQNAKNDNSLPNSAVKSASQFMKVYYYDNELPHGFSLVKESAIVTGGLLTFQLDNNKQQRVTFTQQGLPKDLQNSSVAGGEKVEGAPGSASVNFKEGRTVGTLLTKDKQTMVILNSTDGIDTAVMKDLVRLLQPL